MRSIRRTLLIWILGALSLGALLVALVTYLVTLEEMNEVFDGDLRNVAEAVASYHHAGHHEEGDDLPFGQGRGGRHTDACPPFCMTKGGVSHAGNAALRSGPDLLGMRMQGQNNQIQSATHNAAITYIAGITVEEGALGSWVDPCAPFA